MEMNVDELVKLSEAWLPVVLEYSGKLTLAVITLLIGWWLISRLTSSIESMLAARKVDRALSSFISSLVSIVLRILLLISVASMIGVETTSFIAMIGAAGLAIGPYGLGFFHDAQSIIHVAELGVVLFLFIIGLEMRPSKLWSLRGQIFGLGAAQVLVCCALLSGVAMLAGLPPAAGC